MCPHVVMNQPAGGMWAHSVIPLSAKIDGMYMSDTDGDIPTEIHFFIVISHMRVSRFGAFLLGGGVYKSDRS